MQIVGNPFATGSTSGGMREKPLQSTATKRSNFWRLSLRTGMMRSTPSRKPGFPSAFRSAVA